MDSPRVSAPGSDEDLRQLRVRLAAAGLFLVAVLVTGTVGYRVIDPRVGWIDALYMTTITLTTVGYGEIVDLSGHPGGRLFTILLILAGMGGVLYFVSTATAFVLEGQLGHVFWRRRMQRIIDRMDKHLIVCGSGSTAIYTADELLSVDRDVLVVCDEEGRQDILRRSLPDVPIVTGDPTLDEVLIAAGVERAAGIVAATGNDKDNVLLTLAARQLNPSLRIVSRVTDIHSEKKVRKVGADAVVSPDFIGGLRLASELIRPTVVTFLDGMLRDRSTNLRIDEIRIPAGSRAAGREVGELGIAQIAPEALLMAARTGAGEWHYNPKSDFQVRPGTVLVFMASPDQMRALVEDLGGRMVAPVRPETADGEPDPVGAAASADAGEEEGRTA